MKVLDKFDKIIVNSTAELNTIGQPIAKDKLYLVPHLVEPFPRTDIVSAYGSREFRYALL